MTHRFGLLILAGLVALTGCTTAAGESHALTHITLPNTPTGLVNKPVIDPTTIDVPAINVHSTLVPLGLNKDGTAEVPDVTHPEQAGWFCNSPLPGIKCRAVEPGQVGPAVIYGHVNGNGRPGVFARLKDLQPNDLIKVTLADYRVITFKISRVEKFHKIDFDKNRQAEVYGNVDHPALRLVTCGGQWIGGQYGYQDQYVAFADIQA